MLEIFKSKLTYDQIHSIPINELQMLLDAEEKLMVEREKQMEKAQREANSSDSGKQRTKVFTKRGSGYKD